MGLEPSLKNKVGLDAKQGVFGTASVSLALAPVAEV